jgi:hypothetical protein
LTPAPFSDVSLGVFCQKQGKRNVCKVPKRKCCIMHKKKTIHQRIKRGQLKFFNSLQKTSMMNSREKRKGETTMKNSDIPYGYKMENERLITDKIQAAKVKKVFDDYITQPRAKK